MAETLVYGQILKTEYPSSRVDCKGWGNEDCVKYGYSSQENEGLKNANLSVFRSVFLIPTVTTVLSYSTKLSTVTLTRAQYDLSYLKSTTAYTTAYATTITSKKRHC
jgi:hypothetical protein